MSDEAKSGLFFLITLLAITVTVGLFWRSGSHRDLHVELEKIRLEREKLTSTCLGFCAEGRGFPIRVRGECECVQISDWYKGPK